MVLVLLGVLGLVFWLDGDEAEAAHAADCRMLEEEAPEFHDELRLLSDASLDHTARVDAARSAADQFQTLADRLEDEELAGQMSDAVTAMHATGEALEQQDLAQVLEQINRITPFYGQLYEFVDDNCERWISPGQWDDPGTEPTGQPLPTELPSMPTEMPSMPAPPTNRPASLPQPSESRVTEGKPFAAVLAKNPRAWIPIRIAVTVEVHPPRDYPMFGDTNVVLLRWRATNTGHRVFRAPGDPIDLRFTLLTDLGIILADVGFAHGAPNAPDGCTHPTDPFVWRPGETLEGCNIALIGPVGLRSVWFDSGLSSDPDKVTIGRR